MDMNPRQTAGREERRLQKLGGANACAFCGESNLECLRILENHHVGGRVNDPQTKIPLCFNCHRKATEMQMQEEAILSRQPTPLEAIVAVISCWIAFLESCCQTLRAWLERLNEFIRFLDESYVDWRAAWKEAVQ